MKFFLTLVFNNSYFLESLKLEAEKGPLPETDCSSNMFVFWPLIIALNLTQNK